MWGCRAGGGVAGRAHWSIPGGEGHVSRARVRERVQLVGDREKLHIAYLGGDGVGEMAKHQGTRAS